MSDRLYYDLVFRSGTHMRVRFDDVRQANLFFDAASGAQRFTSPFVQVTTHNGHTWFVRPEAVDEWKPVG